MMVTLKRGWRHLGVGTFVVGSLQQPLLLKPPSSLSFSSMVPTRGVTSLHPPTPWKSWVTQGWHLAHTAPLFPSSRLVGLTPEKTYRSLSLQKLGAVVTAFPKVEKAALRENGTADPQRSRDGSEGECGAVGPCVSRTVWPASVWPHIVWPCLTLRSCIICCRLLYQTSVHQCTCGWQDCAVCILGNCEAGEVFIMWLFFPVF